MNVLWVSLFKLREVTCLIKVSMKVEWAQRLWCCNPFSHSTWTSCFCIKLLICWFVPKLSLCTLDVGEPYFHPPLVFAIWCSPLVTLPWCQLNCFFHLQSQFNISMIFKEAAYNFFFYFFTKRSVSLIKMSNSKAHCYQLHLPIHTELVIISLSLIQ